MTSGDWTEAGVVAGADGLRARARAAEILGAVLAGYGLKAHPIALTGGFRISTLSGRYINARSLGDAWSAAAELAGRPVDPLDPRFTRGVGA